MPRSKDANLNFLNAGSHDQNLKKAQEAENARGVSHDGSCLREWVHELSDPWVCAVNCKRRVSLLDHHPRALPISLSDFYDSPKLAQANEFPHCSQSYQRPTLMTSTLDSEHGDSRKTSTSKQINLWPRHMMTEIFTCSEKCKRLSNFQ